MVNILYSRVASYILLSELMSNNDPHQGNTVRTLTSTTVTTTTTTNTNNNNICVVPYIIYIKITLNT